MFCLALGSLLGCENALLVIQPNRDAQVGTAHDAGMSGAHPDAAPLMPGDDAAPPADDAAPAAMGDDAALDPDAGMMSVADAAQPVPDGGVPVVPCGFDMLQPADRERVVLVGEPFSAVPGVDGTTIRAMRLSTAGVLTPTDTRIDVGFRPARVEFVPSGQFALVLGEEGQLASIAVPSAGALTLVDTVVLPRAGYGDMQVLADGQTVIVAGSNVDISSGLSTVTLACDGQLTIDTAAFHNLRLTYSFDWIDPLQTRAVVLGGQAVFAPVDPIDTRIFERMNGRWTQVATFDLWSDAIDPKRIAVSPDGRTMLAPNGSPFSTQGGTVMVVNITGNVLASQRLIPDMDDAREALFSVDGATALVSLLSANSVAVLADRGMGFVEVSRIRGVGLAETLAAVERGPLTGLVLVTSVDANGGPNIARLQIDGAGVVRDLGQIELGMGSETIPGPLAIQR